MRTQNECWMDLHQLANSLEDEGPTRAMRLDNLVHELLAMPPLVRRELIREVRFLLAELAELEPLAASAVQVTEDC